MSNGNLSVAETLNKLSGATSSFLSSLSGAQGGLTGMASLFDAMLADKHNLAVKTPTSNTAKASGDDQNANKANPNQTVTGNASSKLSASSTSAAAPVTVHQIVSAWKNFVAHWEAHKTSSDKIRADKTNAQDAKTKSVTDGSGNASSSAAADASSVPASTDASSSSSVSSDTMPPETTTCDNAAASAAAASLSTDAAAQDANTQLPSLDQILAELQQVLNDLKKKALDLQNADASSSSDGAGAMANVPAQLGDAVSNDTSMPSACGAMADSAADAAANTDTSSSANSDPATQTLAMVQDLLTLAKSAKDTLGLGQTGAFTTTTTTATDAKATTDILATLDLRLRGNLKTLLDQLKSSGNTKAVALPDGDQSEPVLADAAKADTASTATTTPSMTEMMTSALAVADDFAKHLNTMFGLRSGAEPTAATPSSTVFSASAVAAVTEQDGETKTNTDSGQGGFRGEAAPTAPVDQSLSSSTTVGTGNAKASSPYSFASQLSASRTGSSATGLPSAVEQVMFQLNRKVKNGDDEMSLQLHPADLGSINVKLSFLDDGRVQGSVVASNPTTLDMLQKDVRSLERALQDAGLRADPGSLQFSLGDPSNGNSRQTANNGQAGKAWSGSGIAANDSLSGVSDITEAPDTWVMTPGRINMKV